MNREKIILKNEKEIHIVHIENILAVRVEGYICTFHLENDKKFSCTKSLKELASFLPEFFVRINRNCIVNAKKIELVNTQKKRVHLCDKTEYSVSFQCLKTLRKLFKIHETVQIQTIHL